MNPFRVFSVSRRLRRWAFVLFVAAAVYAGPRFAHDMVDYARGETTTTSAP